MLPLRSILFLLTFLGLSASSVIVPVLGVANYMLIYQIFPEHAWWGIPLAPLGVRYSMTAAVCLMVGILINIHRMPSVRPLLSLWDVGAIVMVIIVISSEFIGLVPASTSAYLTT
ncbi:MAG: hypothetical protein IID43_07360, partial [Planctomycetes bacterium]|nr:hypothetical protein [Planctomycetota bacterium]